MERSAQVLDQENYCHELEEEWVLLLKHTKQAGITIEEVRAFIKATKIKRSLEQG